MTSVVLCCYNQGRFVAKAIESVLAQTHAELELIVVDNGSSDDSRDVIRRFTDPRVHCMFFDRNEAVTKRLNMAIAATTGEFVSLLYADDYYLPEKLERQLACFGALSKDYGVVYSPGYRLNVLTGVRWQEPSLSASGNILQDLLLRSERGFINPISPLVRRECFLTYPFDEDLFVEGESLYLRVAMRFKFFYLDDPVAVMSDHESNIGKAIKANVSRLMTVLDRLKRHPDFPRSSQRAVEIFRSRILRDSGWQGIRVAGDPVWARACFAGAVRSYPFQAIHPRTLGGTVLSVVPGTVLGVANRIANRIRGHKGIVSVINAPELDLASGISQREDS